MTNVSEEFLANEDRQDSDLLRDLKAMVTAHASSHPRHHQIDIGPSEVGHPCGRNVVSRLIGAPPINPPHDPLPSYLGVAGHAALEKAAAMDNARLCRQRWITEQRVQVRPGLTGTCDLYDNDTATVIDFKWPGAAAMLETRKNGPSVIYRTQVHLYAEGWINAGRQVNQVGIWFLPRSGLLSTSLLWTTNYDPKVSIAALERLDSLMLLADELELEQYPARIGAIPTEPYFCTWCPWFSVSPAALSALPHACSGGAEYRPSITNHSGMTKVTP